MEAINITILDNNAFGPKRVRAIILASEAPEDLADIDPADVGGLDPDSILGVGSMIITPSANYIAFEDGVFTEKGGAGE